MATAIIQPVVKLAFLAELNFAAGAVRFWTGRVNLSWGGHTWTGAGEFGGVSPVEEMTDIGAPGITLSLNGVSSSLMTLALADGYRGRSCKLWVVIVDDSNAVVYAYQNFAGRMDVMKITDSGDTCSISLQVENRLIDLKRPRNLRYTDQEQQRLFPGDLGLQYSAKIAEQPIYWGIASPAPASAPAYGGGGGSGINQMR
jgi:hypothetical protein